MNEVMAVWLAEVQMRMILAFLGIRSKVRVPLLPIIPSVLPKP